MAASRKKGGSVRYVFDTLAQNDSFALPPGFVIDRVLAEQIAVVGTAPSVALATTAATQQVGTITVTNTGGNASTVFSIGGVASDTQIGAGYTVAQTVGLIQAVFGKGGTKYQALKDAGWVLTAYNTATGVVTFAGSPAKTSSAPAIVTTSLTTQTVVSAVTTNGVLPVDAMAATSLGATTAKAFKDFTSAVNTAGKIFNAAQNTADITYYINSDLVGIGNLKVYVALRKLN